MATATLQNVHERESTALRRRAQRSRGPLLVATDGTPRSDAALRAAREMVKLTGQGALVLAVHTPLPALGPEVTLASSPGMDGESRARLHDQVVDQMERIGLSEMWPLKVSTGAPAALIAKLARHVEASLIVMGLGGHSLFDRIFGDEMVVQVLRIGTTPVLAVADDFRALPQRVLAAVDFSDSSRRALELGAPLVHSEGSLTLAHVIATEKDPFVPFHLNAPEVASAGRALDAFADLAETAPGVVRETRIVRGEPARELLRLANEMSADLIITGSHGHNFFSRLLLGSVSTALLRKAGRSILVVPPHGVPDVHEELPLEGQRFTFYEWAERLEEFTRLHRWRRATLEVIHPELGAQVVQSDVPFVGASFDARDGHVHIMFGARDQGRQHVTHSIDDVTAIQTMRGGPRGEVYLRIGQRSGQTLLTLER
jgi:nucleotide-binding universal stress UspA family protein